MGIGALALLLWEPHVEGVNANATSLYQIYFDDPFLVLVYAGSIPFFIAIYQTFKVLGYIGENKVFSDAAVRGLRRLKYCALAIIGFVVAEEVIILLNHGDDDAAGAVAIGLFIIFVSAVVAANAAMHEKIWQKALDMKSENDLTI
jgi:hypothetical protein